MWYGSLCNAPIRIPAPAKASASVIFLHGLGDRGDSFTFLSQEAHKRPHLQHINFVLPTAPVRNITLTQAKQTGWYDIFSIENLAGVTGAEDDQGILESLKAVTALVQEEIAKGVPASRIIIGGFSQGAALTLAAAVTSEETLGGFLPLSGYLPIPHTLEKLNKRKNLDRPILGQQGEDDSVVLHKYGVESYKLLKSPTFGFTNVEFQSYPGLEHSLNLQEVERIVDFLGKYVPAKPN